MDGTYFVGRTEILAWINDLLKTNYVKIEETASGAAACQIMDAIYTGKVPLGKVNFTAKAEWEFTNNYKVLQQVFKQCQVDKVIPVDKLVKAKYQDNLEWLQWLKRYFDINTKGDDYDAVGRRIATKCNYPGDKASGAVAKKPKPAEDPSPDSDGVEAPAPVAVRPAPAPAPAADPKPDAAPKPIGTRTRAATTTTVKPKQAVIPPQPRNPAPTAAAAPPQPKPTKPAADDQRISMAVNPTERVGARTADPGRRVSLIPRLAQDERVTELTKQMAQLQVALDNSEKERDFYYNKLLEIEELVQKNKGDALADGISKLLGAGVEEEAQDAPAPSSATEEDAEEY